FLCFVLLSCCSIFKDHFATALAATLLLYHIHSALSIPFAKVFQTFFKVFRKPSVVCRLFADSLHIIAYSGINVKHFFSFFPIFSHFVPLSIFIRHFTRHCRQKVNKIPNKSV
ncbi:MAG: hypothetical protein E7637_09095, partial [Ruminococcaceae bacterium]|nr:hypothetical protein [Oscillospiraceae bacterium]